ncbi:hypothetical protein BJ878DRAFT_403964, partial [Calycina marina]
AWKDPKQAIRPQFSRDQISDLELEEQHIQYLLTLSTLSPGADDWTNDTDLAPLFFNFAATV